MCVQPFSLTYIKPAFATLTPFAPVKTDIFNLILLFLLYIAATRYLPARVDALCDRLEWYLYGGEH